MCHMQKNEKEKHEERRRKHLSTFSFMLQDIPPEKAKCLSGNGWLKHLPAPHPLHIICLQKHENRRGCGTVTGLMPASSSLMHFCMETIFRHLRHALTFAKLMSFL